MVGAATALVWGDVVSVGAGRRAAPSASARGRVQSYASGGGGVSRDRLLWFGRSVAGGTASDTGLASHAERGGRDSKSATRGDGGGRVEYCRGGRGRQEQQRPRVCGLPDGSRSPLGLHMPRLGQAGCWAAWCGAWPRVPSGRRWGIGMGMDGDGERGGGPRGGIVRTPTFSSLCLWRDWSTTHATPPSRTRHSRRDPLPPPRFSPVTHHLSGPPRTNFGHSPPFNSVSLNGCNGCTSLHDQGRPGRTDCDGGSTGDRQGQEDSIVNTTRSSHDSVDTDRPAVPCCHLFRSHLPAARRRVSTRWKEGCVPILPCIPQQAAALDNADQVTSSAPDIPGPVPGPGHQQRKNKP